MVKSTGFVFCPVSSSVVQRPLPSPHQTGDWGTPAGFPAHLLGPGSGNTLGFLRQGTQDQGWFPCSLQLSQRSEDPPTCSSGDTGDAGLIPGLGRSPGGGTVSISYSKQAPVSLPGESHGQRSLSGYSPWGCKQPDITERMVHHILFLTCFKDTSIYSLSDPGNVYTRKWEFKLFRALWRADLCPVLCLHFPDSQEPYESRCPHYVNEEAEDETGD